MYTCIDVRSHSISVCALKRPIQSRDLQQFQSQFADLLCILVEKTWIERRHGNGKW